MPGHKSNKLPFSSLKKADQRLSGRRNDIANQRLDALLDSLETKIPICSFNCTTLRDNICQATGQEAEKVIGTPCIVRRGSKEISS